MNSTSSKAGLIAAAVSAFFIAVSIILVKLASSGAPTLVISGLACLIAVPMLLVYHRLRGTQLDVREILHEHRVPFLKIVVTKVVIGQVLILTGFALTTAVKGVLLLRLEPLFVIGWAVATGKESLDARKVGLLGLLLAGTALIVAPTSISAPNIGDMFVVGALLFFSYSYGPTEEIVKKASSNGLNILTLLLGGLALIAICIGVHGVHCFSVPQDTMNLIVAYAVVFMVVASSLYYFAFATVKPWIIASMLSLETVFGVILATTCLHESVSPMQWVGAAIVIAATCLIARLNHGVESSCEDVVESKSVQPLAK